MAVPRRLPDATGLHPPPRFIRVAFEFTDRPVPHRSQIARPTASGAYLLDRYVTDDDERRWEAAGEQPFDTAPAFLLGRDLASLDDRSTRHERRKTPGAVDCSWERDACRGQRRAMRRMRSRMIGRRA